MLNLHNKYASTYIQKKENNNIILNVFEIKKLVLQRKTFNLKGETGLLPITCIKQNSCVLLLNAFNKFCHLLALKHFEIQIKYFKLFSCFMLILQSEVL